MARHFLDGPRDRRDLNAPIVAIRLAEAALCLDCDVVFLLRRGECPACASRLFMPLATFMDRHAAVAQGEERSLASAEVAGSNPAGRSILNHRKETR